MKDKFYKELRCQLKRHEGVKTKVYKDSLGVLTIGVGRNLESTGLSDKEIDYLLINDINSAINELYKIFNEDFSDSFTVERMKGLTDMIFNLGSTRFRKFKKMIKAIKNNDWELAGEEAKDSKWYKQVGKRGEEIVKQLKEG